MESKYDRYYSIRAIAEDVLDDREETDHKLMRYIKWGLRAFRQVSLHVHQEPITCCLPMDSKRFVDWPEDYIDWTKVAIQVGTKLRTVGVNSNMIRSGSVDECRNPILETDINYFPSGVDFENYGGYFMTNFGGRTVFSYGGASTWAGHFQVNEKLKRIEFNSEVAATNVYLEYISDGIKPNENTFVHPYMADYIYKYIDAEAEKRSSQRSGYSMEYFQRLADHAGLILQGTYNDLDPATFNNLTRKYFNLTVKA